ncbi:MAG: hypothetical protein KL863_06785 [Rhizobium sp.]|nr:hypothetical protein [Rhizobium sp.]
MTGSFLAMVAGWTMLCVTLSSASMAPQCHSNEAFHVVALPYPDDAGNRFAVSRQTGEAPADCVFDEAKADVVIGQAGDPLWFGDLSGSSLVLSRSTGPQGDLVVYDLDSGKAVLDVPSDEYELKGGRLFFWQRVAQATPETCASFAENEANGLGSVIAVLKTLDLKTKAISETGESKCVAVQ